MIAWPSIGVLLGAVARVAAATADEVAAGDERAQLGAGRGARAVWLKPQSGTSVRRSAGTPASRTASIRSATSSAVSTYEFLTSMTPAATSRPAAAISPQDVDLGHLAVGELEHELVDVEAEHRVEDRAVGARRQRPAEVVAEAEVGAEPDPADGPARPPR